MAVIEKMLGEKLEDSCMESKNKHMLNNHALHFPAFRSKNNFRFIVSVKTIYSEHNSFPN